MPHKFHIPVLGLGFSIDTPLKVAKFGINSTVSIVDDELIERMRKYHSSKNELDFFEIPKSQADYRANRIKAYLNLLNKLIAKQFQTLKTQAFVVGSDICNYFELLPGTSSLKHGYELMMDYPQGENRRIFENVLRNNLKIGAIDVNIMAKVDKMNYADGVFTGDENTDALAALRGFAESDLNASVILSAGMNPKLYSYLETFADFMPDESGYFKKRIVLKVSDFRSAFIQAKFLAKKGLWVSEFRVESGLNCGGHAFATDGFLMGPILEEFKIRKLEMLDELFELYEQALSLKQLKIIQKPYQRISAQGGIGTAYEQNFLLKQYKLDATGWGSPFLLVPEVTNVDENTLIKLSEATEDDFYLSNSSPLGIQFNNFRNTSAEEQRLQRVEKGRPGSPCTKKYLCNNAEFTTEPICTASREYQRLKIIQLKAKTLQAEEYQKLFNEITGKICLCEGLCASTYIKCEIIKPKENHAVAICPGPNLAYYNQTYSLKAMVNHIYGEIDLLKDTKRPHIFIKELNLYIDYLQSEIKQQIEALTEKKRKQLNGFKTQLINGISYYKQLFDQTPSSSFFDLQEWFNALETSKVKLEAVIIA